MKNRRELRHSQCRSESDLYELRLQMNEILPNPVTSQNRRTISAIARLFYPPGWGNCMLDNGYEENLWTCKFLTRAYFEYYLLSIFLLALIITLAVPDSQFLDFKRLSGWRWVVLGTVTLCGSLLSREIIDLVIGMLKMTNVCSPNSIHFAYATREVLSYFVWFTAVLFVSWFGVFADKLKTTEYKEKIFGYVVKIFFSLIIATVIWLTKTLYGESRLMSWYRAFYYPKLKLVLFSQFLLQSFLDRQPWSYLVDDENPKLMCFEATVPEGKGTKKLREEVDVSQWLKMHPQNISALRLKTFVDIVRHGPCPTPRLDEQLNREIRDMPLSDRDTHLEMEAEIISDNILQNISMARGSNAE